MQRLSLKNIPQSAEEISVFSYEKSQVKSGIVHFGTGNFHRCHQAVYCDKLLSLGDTRWGITGVSLRSPGIRDALAPQDFLYTHATLSASTATHTPKYKVVGAIQNILVAPENPLAVIRAVASSETQLITTTVTEKGYYLAGNKVCLEHNALQNDKTSLNTPQTLYGYIAAGIIERHNTSAAKLTVMCCDNIRGGGEHLREGVEFLLGLHTSAVLSWSKENVSFISSMVDRISPATDEALIENVSEAIGYKDEWPVSSEAFTQWVIEDNFIGEKPDFEKVGALLVSEVAPYEEMKLRFLNAAHSMASVLGYLHGDEYVHQTLSNKTLLEFVQKALLNNVLPVNPIPEGYDGKQYITEVLARFQDSAIPYRCQQVNTDSSIKIQQRWLPTLEKAIHSKIDNAYLIFTFSAWLTYIHTAIKNNALNDDLSERLATVVSPNEESLSQEAIEQLCLLVSGENKFTFFQNPECKKHIAMYYQKIHSQGIMEALSDFQAHHTHTSTNIDTNTNIKSKRKTHA